jgi:hypothetical protein
MLKTKHVEKNSMLNSGIQHVKEVKVVKAKQRRPNTEQVQMRLLRAETSV